MTWGPVSLPASPFHSFGPPSMDRTPSHTHCLLSEKIWGALSIWAPLLPCPQEQLCLTTGTLGCGVRCPINLEKITNSSGTCSLNLRLQWVTVTPALGPPS